MDFGIGYFPTADVLAPGRAAAQIRAERPIDFMVISAPAKAAIAELTGEG